MVRYLNMQALDCYAPNSALLRLRVVFWHMDRDSLSTLLSLTLLVSMPRDFKFYRAKNECAMLHTRSHISSGI